MLVLLLVAAMPLADSALAQCSGDVNNDGVVDDADYALCEGLPDCSVCDVNWDGVVDEDDLGIISDEMTANCTGFRAVPLAVWDPNCYTGGCNWACQDGKGCLPIDQNGVGFADFNADGWPDAATSAQNGGWRRFVFRNNGAPVTWTSWQLGGADPNSGYGVHWGDYNGDGYAEYAASKSATGAGPFDIIFRLNRVDPNNNPATALTHVSVCVGLTGTSGNHETLAWGDVDGDLKLDLFVPTYEPNYVDPNFWGDPNSVGGNRLLTNLGVDPNDPNNCPAQPPVLYKFDPNAANAAGLQSHNPAILYRRPEGCFLCDYDQDGDLDFYFSEHIWQNVTTAAGSPVFWRLDESHTGLDIRGQPGGQWPEEGCLLADFDMDGDLDVLRVLRQDGDWCIARSRGDGTFDTQLFEVQSELGFGASAADWDNDGDLDFTAGGAFWRNLTIEGLSSSGSVGPFAQVVCLDDNVYGEIFFCLPSWADVDGDGDLDCARSAWGNGAGNAKFFINRLHAGECGACDESLRRYVRVRPVREAPLNGPTGKQRDYTENEYGARVEVALRTDLAGVYANNVRRVQTTSSAAGYLNQNEYLLHFGLPADPDPNDPNEDLHVDVYVDFPMRSNEPNDGPWRVDWTVNPQLKNINLADLYMDCKDEATLGRPITVYREGRVRFKGADPNWAPNDPNIARLYTLGGPLRLPDPNQSPLPAPTSGSYLAGLRFEKEPNSPALRVREIIVDGQLDVTTYGCAYNIVLLDVTDPNNLVAVGKLNAKTYSGNYRSFIHVPPDSDPNDPNAFVLPANGPSTTTKYEIRVRVTSYRENTLPDLTGLGLSGAGLGVVVDKNLRKASSTSANICTANMALDTTAKSPVTLRLSFKGN